MGRATYIQLRNVRLKQDYQKPSERGLTQERLFEFYDSSFGPVSYKLGELGLVRYSAEEGRQIVDSERVLNPIREGKYWDVVYGNEGQYNEGTLLTRSRSRKRSNSNTAQARTMRDQFLEYTRERALLSADYGQRLTVEF